MGSILTNTGAMVALQTMRQINRGMETVQGQIATGLKVGTAKDNAATWAISKVMESDVSGFKAIKESLALGSSTVNVARNAAETTTKLLTEIKEKIVLAQEENVDRVKIQADIEQLRGQIDSVINSAQFNGLNLVKGRDEVTVLSSLDRSGTSVQASRIEVARQELSTDRAAAGGEAFDTTGVDENNFVANVADNAVDIDATTAGAGMFGLDAADWGDGELSATLMGARTVRLDFDNFDGTTGASDVLVRVSVGSEEVTLTMDFAAGLTEADARDVIINAINDNDDLRSLGIRASLGDDAGDAYVAITRTGGLEDVSLNFTGLNNSDIVDGIELRQRAADGTTYEAVSGDTAGDETRTLFNTAGQFNFTRITEAGGADQFGVGTAVTLSLGSGPTRQEFTVVAAEEGTSAGQLAELMAAEINRAGAGFSAEAVRDGDGALTGEVRFAQSSGADSTVRVTVSNDGVAAGGLAALNDIDVTNDDTRAQALAEIEAMIQTSIDAASSFGQVQRRIEIQQDFVSNLMDTLRTGIGALVDADMEEASARLQALQVQQQLGIQSLSIANQQPQNILALFR